MLLSSSLKSKYESAARRYCCCVLRMHSSKWCSARVGMERGWRLDCFPPCDIIPPRKREFYCPMHCCCMAGRYRLSASYIFTIRAFNTSCGDMCNLIWFHAADIKDETPALCDIAAQAGAGRCADSAARCRVD